MAINSFWYVENNVVYMQIAGDLSEGMKDTIDRVLCSYLDKSTSQQVHVLLDFRTIGKLLPMYSLLQMECFKHGRLGYILLIGTSEHPALRVLMAAVGTILKLKYREFYTPEGALAYLQYADCSLPDMEQYHYRLPKMAVR